MFRRGLLIIGLLISVIASVRAVQQNPPAPPTFKGGVDLMQLDVSVLDRNRKPVTGLKASDFTIVEDGKPRNVETLLEINIPPVPRANAVLQADVPQDVATNATVRDAKRIVVIVIDDISIARLGRVDAYVIAKTREVARTTLEQLGPQDLAAVVHTNNTFSAQSLTTDHSRLRAAIENSSLVTTSDEGVSGPASAASGECMCGLCSPETLGNVASALKSIPDRRKTVVFISAGIVLPPPDPPPSNPCFLAPFAAAMQNAFNAAQQANVNIHAFDPTGLVVSTTPLAGAVGIAAGTRTVMGIDPRQEYLRTVAENTGGRVVVNNNDPDLRVAQVLDESRSYYLLGFQPADLTPDGRRRKLEVRVNRRDASVEARDSYVVPKPGDAPSPDAMVANRLLPGTVTEMRATASPFARMDGTSSVAIALAFIGSSDVMTADTIELVARATSQINGETKTYRQTFRFSDATAATGQHIELLAKLPVTPGRYDIRLGVGVRDKESSGVYVPVEIPEFSKDDLSISGLMLSETPPRGVPRGALADLAPVVPTTRRTFTKTDRISAFVRAYQKGDGPAPVASVSVVDAAGTSVVNGTAPLTSKPFGKLRAADCSFDLPLQRLAPGRYVLSIEVTSAKNKAQRATRFSVE